MTEPGEPISTSPYEVPDPYGQAGGTESASGIAAPLLAGGALALAGVVIQQADALRYPGLTLLALTGAVLLLVTAVQSGMWARQYAVTPGDISQWWPDPNQRRVAAIARDQRRYAERHGIWARRVTITFNLGVLLLWVSLAVAIVPKYGDHEAGWRWVAVVLAAFGALVEAVWTGLVLRGPVAAGQRLAWASHPLYGRPADRPVSPPVGPRAAGSGSPSP